MESHSVGWLQGLVTNCLIEAWVQGWEPGRSPEMTDLGVARDTDACASWSCDGCGHCGLLYRPLRVRDGGVGYRFLAVCPACGHAEEY
jgi:hypothetical protein